MTVQAFSQNVVSISIPAGKVKDVSGNQNSASNTLEVKHCKNNTYSCSDVSGFYFMQKAALLEIYLEKENKTGIYVHTNSCLSTRDSVYTDSTPAISTALHSFVTAGILATSLTAAILSLSSANLGAIGNLYSGSTNFMASDPSMNLHVSNL